MSIIVRCQTCGRLLKAPADSTGRRGECPFCGRTINISSPSSAGAASVTMGSSESDVASTAPFESTEIENFLDPPSSEYPAASADAASAAAAPPKNQVWRRMFEALIDPRSIQWMLMIGGGLCVLGLIIWLISLGVFKDPRILAITLGVGTLAILGAGWFLTLRTRYRIAGQALTFLGCVVAPLNLWFYHAQNLITVQGHLWVGGVVCCLLYAATVVMLRDPVFMYAIEAGATLTTLLLLADMGKITDTTWLSLFFMALGIISIHCERMFSPADDSEFPRRRFGLPLFWSGHVQVAASLLILLGSQLLSWMAEPARQLFGISWAGNLLTDNYLLATGVWLAGMYVYLYSDIVVRKIGVYLALAGACLVMAEVTLLLGFDVRAEWILAAMAITSVAINVVHHQWPGIYKNADRFVPPLGLVLGFVPALWGIALHIRATSAAAAQLSWTYATGYEFVVVMLITAVANRVNAYLCRRTDPKSSSAYFFVSAASLLVAAAGLLRVLGVVQWSDQAPWMMLIPIGYLIASRLWRGHSAEKPLYWIAQAATAVILLHVFGATMQNISSFAPMHGEHSSLMLGLVFAEAAAFYFIAGMIRRRSVNIYLAAAAACGALWQFFGYYGIDERYYTMLYAGFGVVCIAASRILGLEQVAVYRTNNEKSLVVRGRGLSAFQCGNGILGVACLAAIMQGLAGLATRTGDWLDIGSLLATTGAAVLAAVIVPAINWRRVYLSAAVAIGAVMFLRLNLLIHLSGWQKLEIFCVAIGFAMLVASHIGLFREADGERNENVGVGLEFGSILVTIPLMIAVLYNRWVGGEPSIYDEMALLTLAIPMFVTGLSWKIRSTTLWSGASLIIYLIVLIASLAYRPQVAIGVYMAVGGAIVFAIGIVLSMYRDKLVEIPDQVANRTGIFRILNWR
jgi:hypothetical protein